MQKLTAYTLFVHRVLRSNKFLWIIVALLVLQALWIALTGLYPMAFDEDFHMGVITVYANNHFSPFLSGQPVGADAYGAVARDPSYLYHYLMSFPFRFTGLFTDNIATQVLILRFLNIAFFASCLPLFRRLLLKTGASRAVVHTVLLIFVLIPVVPLLAAQVNYDNVIIPITALCLLLAVNFAQELQATKRFNVQVFGWLVIVSMLGSLVKYAFLPVVLGIGLYFAVLLFRTYHSWRKLLVSIGFGITLITRPMRWLLLVLFIISAILFGQRYGVNVIKYHKPVVDCGKVLTVEQCSQYGPWRRDYQYAQHKDEQTTNVNIVIFTGEWFYGMWMRSFFAVDGATTGFQTRGPLLMPGLVAIVGAVSSIVLLVVYGKRIFQRYNRSVLWLFTIVPIIYIITLFLDEFEAYVRTGQPVAINGRYLFPILPLLLLFAGLAWREYLQRQPHIKVMVLTLGLLCLVWGGGVLTYVIRSNDSWYWNSAAVRSTNHVVQDIFTPITPGADKPRLFLSN
jgi:hypothetical protein